MSLTDGKNRPLKKLATACTAIVFVLSTTGYSLAQEDSQQFLNDVIQRLGSKGPQSGECGPASDGTGTIVGRFLKERLTNASAMIYPAGSDADAYLDVLKRSLSRAPGPTSATPQDAIAMMAKMSAEQNASIRLLKKIRVAVIGNDGRFTCKGLASGRYLLVVETTRDTAKGPIFSAYTAEALLPPEKAGYRYIATSSGFTELQPR